MSQAGGLQQRHSLQLISQESNPGVRYEYYLPMNDPGRGFSWSHGSWGDCSAECGGGKHWGPGENKYPVLKALHYWGGTSPHMEKVRCPHEGLQPTLGWGRPRRSGTLGVGAHDDLSLTPRTL